MRVPAIAGAVALGAAWAGCLCGEAPTGKAPPPPGEQPPGASPFQLAAVASDRAPLGDVDLRALTQDTLTFEVYLHNAGDTVATGTVADVTTQAAGVRVVEGSTDLGDVEPGGVAKAVFTIKVEGAATGEHEVVVEVRHGGGRASFPLKLDVKPLRIRSLARIVYELSISTNMNLGSPEPPLDPVDQAVLGTAVALPTYTETTLALEVANGGDDASGVTLTAESLAGLQVTVESMDSVTGEQAVEDEGLSMVLLPYEQGSIASGEGRVFLLRVKAEAPAGRYEIPVTVSYESSASSVQVQERLPVLVVAEEAGANGGALDVTLTGGGAGITLSGPVSTPTSLSAGQSDGEIAGVLRSALTSALRAYLDGAQLSFQAATPPQGRYRPTPAMVTAAQGRMFSALLREVLGWVLGESVGLRVVWDRLGDVIRELQLVATVQAAGGSQATRLPLNLISGTPPSVQSPAIFPAALLEDSDVKFDAANLSATLVEVRDASGSVTKGANGVYTIGALPLTLRFQVPADAASEGTPELVLADDGRIYRAAARSQDGEVVFHLPRVAGGRFRGALVVRRPEPARSAEFALNVTAGQEGVPEPGELLGSDSSDEALSAVMIATRGLPVRTAQAHVSAGPTLPLEDGSIYTISGLTYDAASDITRVRLLLRNGPTEKLATVGVLANSKETRYWDHADFTQYFVADESLTREVELRGRFGRDFERIRVGQALKATRAGGPSEPDLPGDWIEFLGNVTGTSGQIEAVLKQFKAVYNITKELTKPGSVAISLTALWEGLESDQPHIRMYVGEIFYIFANVAYEPPSFFSAGTWEGMAADIERSRPPLYSPYPDAKLEHFESLKSIDLTVILANRDAPSIPLCDRSSKNQDGNEKASVSCVGGLFAKKLDATLAASNRSPLDRHFEEGYLKVSGMLRRRYEIQWVLVANGGAYRETYAPYLTEKQDAPAEGFARIMVLSPVQVKNFRWEIPALSHGQSDEFKLELEFAEILQTRLARLGEVKEEGFFKDKIIEGAKEQLFQAAGALTLTDFVPAFDGVGPQGSIPNPVMYVLKGTERKEVTLGQLKDLDFYAQSKPESIVLRWEGLRHEPSCSNSDEYPYAEYTNKGIRGKGSTLNKDWWFYTGPIPRGRLPEQQFTCTPVEVQNRRQHQKPGVIGSPSIWGGIGSGGNACPVDDGSSSGIVIDTSQSVYHWQATYCDPGVQECPETAVGCTTHQYPAWPEQSSPLPDGYASGSATANATRDSETEFHVHLEVAAAPNPPPFLGPPCPCGRVSSAFSGPAVSIRVPISLSGRAHRLNLEIRGTLGGSSGGSSAFSVNPPDFPCGASRVSPGSFECSSTDVVWSNPFYPGGPYVYEPTFNLYAGAGVENREPDEAGCGYNYTHSEAASAVVDAVLRFTPLD